jgi:hypothetical protein
MILEQGLDFAHPNMTQVDAQYVETRRQTVEEICRWFRVPPHKVAELSRAHFANVENLNIDYATDALMPWIKRLEEEADWKLIGPRSQADFTKIAIQALMRGDSKARGQWYKEMFHIGVFSPNEIRAFEDMDPIGDEGDEHYIQSQFTTLKNIVSEEEEPSVTPGDAAQQALESASGRLLSAELKKAVLAQTRYNRDEFVVWMDRQNLYGVTRRERAFEDIAPILVVAHGDVDVDLLSQTYIAAERLELLELYDGGQPREDRIVTALMEVL